MDISPNALRKELVATLKQIEVQIEEVEKEAQNKGILPSQLRDTNGGWAMSPLLVAKTQVYSSLVQLNQQGRR